jgi:O-methyltransferase
MKCHGRNNMVKALVRRAFKHFGFNVVREGPLFPPDLDQESVEIARSVLPFTMTTPERLFALIQAVRYLVKANIPGGFVECGVWRGGSMMAAAQTLKRLDSQGRKLHLFDTYEGMPRPTDRDVNFLGKAASVEFEHTRKGSDASEWCYASLEDVRRNLFSTGYSKELITFVKGKVEDTIPGSAPDSIALLRLDTDWYESTSHELVHLFPRLSAGGVLIIDDYGYWQGARRAVDEYLASNNISILLDRLDDSARIAVKR